jgi:GNAT superfamily N-acetyltransferase
MNRNDIKIWSNLTIKTQSYRKNFDMVSKNDNIITEYNGTISILRIAEQQLPLIVGEYALSVWNIGLSALLGVDIKELLRVYAIETIYEELASIVDDGTLDINKYKKIVLIRTLVLHPEYRKHGITEEFIETIYRDLYSEDIAIIALVMPFQDNPIDADYYLTRKGVRVTKKSIFGYEEREIAASDYYSLKELMSKNDCEMNEYKLFSVVTKCGFFRIGDTHLFQFTPENTIERMLSKYEYVQEGE